MPFADLMINLFNLETVKVYATQIGIGYIEPDQGITITGVSVSLSPAWVQEQLHSMTDEFLGNMRTAIEHFSTLISSMRVPDHHQIASSAIPTHTGS